MVSNGASLDSEEELLVSLLPDDVVVVVGGIVMVMSVLKVEKSPLKATFITAEKAPSVE